MRKKNVSLFVVRLSLKTVLFRVVLSDFKGGGDLADSVLGADLLGAQARLGAPPPASLAASEPPGLGTSGSHGAPGLHTKGPRARSESGCTSLRPKPPRRVGWRGPVRDVRKDQQGRFQKADGPGRQGAPLGPRVL